MKVSGEYTFDAPQEQVWEALQDPDILASILPGCEELALTGKDEYEGALKIKVGPVQGKFNGKVKLENKNPPESYDMQIDGRGAPGFVKGTGGLKLTAQGDKTLMTYEGDAQIGGRIASVGQRLVDSSAKSIIRQSLEALNTTLVAQTATTGGGESSSSSDSAPDAPAVTQVNPPSQMEFAATVAKDVATDLIPAQYRPLAIGLGILILIAILYLIFN